MKKFLIYIFLMLACTASAQIDLAKRTLVYDFHTDSYLCSVPESMFDDGSVQNFQCDTAKVRFTFLPIVRLNGEFGYEYAQGTVDVIMPDMSNQENLMAKLKWRGASTNMPDKHKRNYHIKFLDADGKKKDRKFFGLRNDNSWLLDAAQVDMSRIRNRVATDLWNDFASKPYYIDKEPKALTGTRGQFVEVFLNNEYRGIYCMTENIDRSQMKLKKYTENSDGTVTIHGQLWKSSSNVYTNFWGYNDYDNTSGTWGGFESKYPEIDDVPTLDWSVIYEAQKFVADCTYEEFAKNIYDYIDMPVYIDYQLFTTLLSAIDNVAGKNKFWACYDREVDKKITLAVWDLDACVGESWDPTNYRDPIYSPYNIDPMYFWGMKPTYLLDSLDINGYRQAREARWKELRKTHFSEASLTKRYSDYMNMLTKTGAYAREKERWDGDSDIGGKTFDFAEEQQYITTWIKRRLRVLDKDFPYCPEGIEEITCDDIGNGAIFNLQGQRITSPGRSGVYIKNGKKYVVRD